MQLISLADTPPYDPQRFVANLVLSAEHCNARVIRLSPGQALPGHSHGVSDLMLFVVEGDGVIGGPDGEAPFTAGSLAHLRGDEELRVRNDGTSGLTLLAVLSPPFPPAAS